MQYIVLFQQFCPQFTVVDAAGVGKGLKLPVLFKAPVVVQQTGGYGKPEIIFVRLFRPRDFGRKRHNPE